MDTPKAPQVESAELLTQLENLKIELEFHEITKRTGKTIMAAAQLTNPQGQVVLVPLKEVVIYMATLTPEQIKEKEEVLKSKIELIEWNLNQRTDGAKKTKKPKTKN